MSVEQRFIRIGDTAPDFEANSQLGTVKWHDFIDGKWALLCSHPKDFTPVCATELGRLAHLKDEFEKRNCVIAGLSVDSKENHVDWISDINDIAKCNVDYHIIADPDRKVSALYGMLDQTNFAAPEVLPKLGLPLTVRSVFLIDPNKKVNLIITYPASTGRNFDEILRVLDSLQLTAYHKVATPADWKAGEECVVVPSLSTDEAKKLFPKGVREVRPWIRFTPDPREASS